MHDQPLTKEERRRRQNGEALLEKAMKANSEKLRKFGFIPVNGDEYTLHIPSAPYIRINVDGTFLDDDCDVIKLVHAAGMRQGANDVREAINAALRRR